MVVHIKTDDMIFFTHYTVYFIVELRYKHDNEFIQRRLCICVKVPLYYCVQASRDVPQESRPAAARGQEGRGAGMPHQVCGHHAANGSGTHQGNALSLTHLTSLGDWVFTSLPLWRGLC
jgi:hypothetical protein